MFGQFKIYDRIYVTGPQRSGTTIASRMIAYDTRHKCIDEADYKWKSPKFNELKKLKNVVIHCPLFCHIIQRHSDSNTMIVMIFRPIDEIVRSQNRVSWDGEKEELKKYGMDCGVISEIKYDKWLEQKNTISHYAEIAYHSLRFHPLWRNKREQFSPKQTSYKSYSMISWL